MTWSYYLTYILYCIPFVFVYRSLIKKSSEIINKPAAFWFSAFVFILVICIEIFHLYLIAHMGNKDIALYRHRSNVVYLPIIWTVFSIAFIYIGIQKNIAIFNQLGTALIGMMFIKLYAFDVWNMDQVSRIIAFIVLGLLLLISSFMFQKLKKLLTGSATKTPSSNTD